MKKIILIIAIALSLMVVACNNQNEVSNLPEKIIVPHSLDLIQSLQIANQPGMQWMERERTIYKDNLSHDERDEDEVYWEMRVYDSPESQTPVASKGYLFMGDDVVYKNDEGDNWEETEKREDTLYDKYITLYENLKDELKPIVEENKDDSKNKENEELSVDKKESFDLVLGATLKADKLKSIEALKEFFSYIEDEEEFLVNFKFKKENDAMRIKYVSILGTANDKNKSIKEAILNTGEEKSLGGVLPHQLVHVLIKDKKMIGK